MRPRPLGPCEHEHYWLARTYVARTPSWLALVDDVAPWPEDARRHLVEVAGPLDGPPPRRALVEAIERYDWSELWWGEDPAPALADRRRLASLMCAWSVPRTAWSALMGTTRAVFEERLDLLLTICAGAARRAITEHWRPHWVHLPRAKLGMRRPIELMSAQGLDAMRRVRDLVWVDCSAK